MLDEATQILIYTFKKVLYFLLNTADIGYGVTVGYIYLGIALIGMLIATILSRPISNNVDRFVDRFTNRGKDNE